MATKLLVTIGTAMTFGTIASSTYAFASSLSEASLLVIWGGVLLVMARGVRRRHATPVLTPGRSSDRTAASGIRLGVGARV